MSAPGPTRQWSTNDYTVGKRIGKSSFGFTFVCTEKATGNLIAVKETSFLNLTPQEHEDAERDSTLITTVDHPNIIKFLGSFREDTLLRVVLEHPDGGSLAEKIQSAGTTHFPEAQIVNWFTQLCQAVKYVHHHPLIHRDISAKNIFLTKSGILKLGDFGSRPDLRRRTMLLGPYYIAPEVCKGGSYTSKNDIWSLGCVLYEMCTFKHPFQDKSILGFVIRILKQKPEPVPSTYSQKLRDLIDRLLAKDPARRPTIDQIVGLDVVPDQKSPKSARRPSSDAHKKKGSGKPADPKPAGKSPFAKTGLQARPVPEDLDDFEEPVIRYFFKGSEIPIDAKDPAVRLQAARHFAAERIGEAKFKQLHDVLAAPGVFEASEEELNGRCQQILGPGFEVELVDLVRQIVINELPTEEGV
jgi:NIMA (never in mitosis gene a)-related kinase